MTTTCMNIETTEMIDETVCTRCFGPAGLFEPRCPKCQSCHFCCTCTKETTETPPKIVITPPKTAPPPRPKTKPPTVNPTPLATAKLFAKPTPTSSITKPSTPLTPKPSKAPDLLIREEVSVFYDRKGSKVKLRGERQAGWGKGWVRTKKGVALGMVASWRVTLSEEHGGKVHVIGVVSEGKRNWDDHNFRDESDSAWVAQSDAVFANGTLQGGLKKIFQKGETVHLTLDRSAHTLTIVGSLSTAIIPNLPVDGSLYPAMFFLTDVLHVELLDFDCKPADHEVKSSAKPSISNPKPVDKNSRQSTSPAKQPVVIEKLSKPNQKEPSKTPSSVFNSDQISSPDKVDPEKQVSKPEKIKPTVPALSSDEVKASAPTLNSVEMKTPMLSSDKVEPSPSTLSSEQVKTAAPVLGSDKVKPSPSPLRSEKVKSAAPVLSSEKPTSALSADEVEPIPVLSSDEGDFGLPDEVELPSPTPLADEIEIPSPTSMRAEVESAMLDEEGVLAPPPEKKKIPPPPPASAQPLKPKSRKKRKYTKKAKASKILPRRRSRRIAADKQAKEDEIQALEDARFRRENEKARMEKERLRREKERLRREKEEAKARKQREKERIQREKEEAKARTQREKEQLQKEKEEAKEQNEKEKREKEEARMRVEALAREAKEREVRRIKEEKIRRALEARRISARILKRKQDQEHEARKRQKLLEPKPQAGEVRGPNDPEPCWCGYAPIGANTQLRLRRHRANTGDKTGFHCLEKYWKCSCGFIAKGTNWSEILKNHLGKRKRSECPLGIWTCKCGYEYMGTPKQRKIERKKHFALGKRACMETGTTTEENPEKPLPEPPKKKRKGTGKAKPQSGKVDSNDDSALQGSKNGLPPPKVQGGIPSKKFPSMPPLESDEIDPETKYRQDADAAFERMKFERIKQNQQNRKSGPNCQPQ